MDAAYNFEFDPGSTPQDLRDPASARNHGVASFVEVLRHIVRAAVRSEAQHPMSASTHSRQRRHARKPIAVRASCGGDWGVSDCLISDISEGGASVVCGHAPNVGEHVMLELRTAAKNERLRVPCSVRHVSGTHTGLAFLSMSADKKHHISDLIMAG